MGSRLLFLLVVIFFITMNVLLWRAEFGTRQEFGGTVPVEVVWEKMLLAPDFSKLEIRHRGVRVGSANWLPNVGQDFATGRRSLENPPEGMIAAPSYYSIDFDGHLTTDDKTHVTFNMDFRFGTSNVLKGLRLHLTTPPVIWRIQSSADDQTVSFGMEIASNRLERVVTYTELANPEKLLREFSEGAALLTALQGFGIPLKFNQPGGIAVGLKWEARNARLQIGRSRVRVYRLETRLLERLRVVLYVSTVGEIFRAELPDNFVLVNEALLGLE